MPAEIILFVAVLYLLYKYYVSNYNYWESRGIWAVPGKFPFGNDINLITQQKFQAHIYDKMYYEFSPHPYFGFYTMRTPLLVLRDPEMIRIVMAKEFTHFQNRVSIPLLKSDVLSYHLFNLNGDIWKAMRVKLTPTFTSGKLKAMFPLFVKCCKELNILLNSEMPKTVDVKDITARFTTDIISSCAFGLDSNSISEANNEMRKIGKSAISKKIVSVIRNVLVKTFPEIIRRIGIRIIPLQTEKMLMKIVKDTIEYRERTKTKRNDFLDLLIELRNKGTLGYNLKEETNENTNYNVDLDLGLLTAQCFVFFVAGFETSSSVQSNTLFELALNQEIQQKLREEIERTIKKHGDITYEAVKEMEYLDMVISESLRKYPTLPTLVRVCTKTYTTPAGHKIEKGDQILIPVWSLQHDPNYFPDPDKFDPERFSSDNKVLIKPFTHLPFGEGPRNCIGMRFGLLQTKMGLITILRNFKVEKTEETKIPIEFRGTVVALPTEPIKLKFTGISSTN